MILIILSRNFWGRGFFSSLLNLNGQETTSFISTCFSAMIIFVAFQFVFASFKVIRWIAASSYRRVATLNLLESSDDNFSATIDNTVKELKRETDYLREQRNKAAKINRIALLISFLVLISGSLWLIYLRPAVILYYRAEFQLKTFVNPSAAYKTLEHLSNKYPNYRYLDSVKYRMAWILDRRMNKNKQAFKAYVEFIENYAPESVWVDEAAINLVSLSLDKLNKPEQAIKWSKKYLELYPDGIMAPHIYLYRIRAYARLNEFKKAEKEIKIARDKYSGKSIQIFNKEDRLVEIINFDDALNVEISEIKGLQRNL
ncbi:MAG: tetratricopeptide repeat protein [Candidatus Rifleibacteriota bacterium]